MLANNASAYSIETHAYLTSEIINFYNKNFPDAEIHQDLRAYLIDGARREDDIPRWMNHFFDPVYNRGLNDPALGNWQASKDWARDDNNQNSPIYKVPATIASILTAIQQKRLGLISDESNFTWQKAIELYVQGEKEKAMFTLGHILHLIEDASVPDHTRNDPHPGDSPYENWTEKFTLKSPDKNSVKRLEGKTPIKLGDLDVYFDELARYSNNNFYSKDTIGIQSGYKLPEPDYVGRDGIYHYAFKLDDEGKEYHLLAYTKPPSKYLWAHAKEVVLRDEGQDFVISDYWSRLSVRAIQYGAGVIDLFFREVEKAKSGPNFTQKNHKFFLAEAINFFENIISQMASFSPGSTKVNQLSNSAKDSSSQLTEKDNLSNSSEAQAEFKKSNKVTNVKIDSLVSDFSQSVKLSNSLPTADFASTTQKIALVEERALEELSASTTKLPWGNCKFVDGENKPISRGKMVINEIAWLNPADNNQWIELKNLSSSEISLTNWQLVSRNDKIKIVFAEGKKISPGEFILLEESNDNSAPTAAADLIYAGSLLSANDGLRLFDAQCQLIDEVLANPNWPAGEEKIGSQRKTMERDEDGIGWHTSRTVGGTPKAENSLPLLSSSGNYVQPLFQNQPPAGENSQPAKILITEVQITGGSGKTENDFVELYNPNNTPINLKGYRLVKRTKNGSSDILIKSWNNDTFVPALSFYLWANSGYLDISVSPGTTTAQTLSDNNSIAIRFGSNDSGVIIDSVGWGEAQTSFVENQAFPANPGANQSLQRKIENGIFVDTDNNATDFEIQNCPSPQALSRICSPPIETISNPVGHLLISEIYPDKTGNNFDFVELYNPTEATTSLANYSLKILKGTSTNSASLTDFSADYFIAPKSFFLIGLDEYNQSTSSPADVFRSSSFLPTTQPARVVLTEGENFVDEVEYDPANIRVGQSLERKAWSGNSCVSSSGEGEFLGNGCDTDADLDWETRELPNPQNSRNLPEPRLRPTTPQDFTIYYSSTTLELTLSWQQSQDSIGATSTITYRIADLSQPSSTLSLSQTSSTSAVIAIDEVGRNYTFSLQAFDREGLSSEIVSSTIYVPSFLKELYFYKNPNSPGKYLVEFTFDSYPFLPDVRLVSGNPGNNWKAMVFYFNQDAPKDKYLRGTSAPNSQATSVVYHQCSGYHSPKSVLILADSADSCQSYGEIKNEALQLQYLEDNRFLSEELIIPPGDISSDSFITVAYYGFARFYPPGSDSTDNFRLIAIDKVRYHFQNELPVHQPPTVPTNYELSFSRDTSNLTILLPAAKDSDSVDKLISYQFNFTTSTEGIFDENNWRSMYWTNDTNLAASFEVIYKNSYTVGIKVADDLGNYSIATTSWSFPDDFLIVAEQRQYNGAFNVNPTAVGQTFVARYSGYAKGLQFISQGFYGGWRGMVQAFIYDTDDPRNASSTNLLAISNQDNADKQKYVLSFSPAPFLEAGRSYLWVVRFQGVTSNLEGVGEEVGAGGSGWTQFGGGNWYRCDGSSGSCYGARNYYFVLFGSNSAE